MKTKRLAAVFMAVVMVIAMAVPAFADDGQEAETLAGSPGSALSSMTFSKVVDADNNTFLPNETIKFTVEAAEASAGETYNGEPVYSGSEGSGTITANDVTVNPAHRGKQTYSSTLNFSSLSFNKPGIYKYTVSENAGTNADMSYDSTPRILYVYVEWEDTSMTKTRVYGAAMTKAGSKSANFDNEYKKSNKTGEEFKDLTIKKTVSGAQADKDKLFTFYVTITSGSGRTTYVVHKTDGSEGTLTSGTPYKFELKHNETITIENLSTNDTYTVVEDADSTKGYTVTGEVKDATNMPAANTTVTVINEKKEVTPTGIFMSYAPYIAMIAAAAALALVFRRRREEI